MSGWQQIVRDTQRWNMSHEDVVESTSYFEWSNLLISSEFVRESPNNPGSIKHQKFGEREPSCIPNCVKQMANDDWMAKTDTKCQTTERLIKDQGLLDCTKNVL